MKRQRGAAVLLLSSVLILLSLLVSLSYSQLVLYQIRKVHNETAARQNFWIAEGGLECAFSQLTEPWPPSHPLDNCGLPEELQLSVIEQSNTLYRIISRYKGAAHSGYFFLRADSDGVVKVVKLEGGWFDYPF
ncbi:hypothetical protein [Vibrio sp. SCSIO 43137]|uniref:hypothetical protein n=1 Tax=Vibrio sp. SCSIO 43137 TaxID=3021011 RepID=UPI0023072D09|nr:hypothetical protein [Vibrio sp. SCSIO 43137]WCE30365.1 hypothetical protein PK654_03515 [Vibrio sp. SCSIO 43137]